MRQECRLEKGSRSRSRPSIQVLLVVSVLIVVGLTGRAAGAEPIDFDVKAQALAPALRAFAEQANVQVYYAEDLVAGLKTAGVKGRLEIEPALTELLKGSGLGFQRTDDKTIVIVKLPGQSPEGPAGRFAEAVIVSATRRDEDVRDVPASVAVVGGEMLQESGTAKLEDYVPQTPGVNLNKTEPQRSQVIMRGISTSVASGLSQTPVGIFVDEVSVSDYFIPISTLDLTPFDLERVEILRGPQGTLFGAATLGGALRYITKKPNLTRTEAAVNLSPASVASGGINYLTQAMFNVAPAPDTLALRGVLSYTKDSGYVDNLTTGQKDWNSLSQVSGRLLARWRASEHVSVDANLILQNTDSNGSAGVDPATSGPDFRNPSQGTLREAVDKYRQRIGSVGVNWDLGFANLLSSTSFLDKERQDALYELGALSAYDQVTGIEFLLAALELPIMPGDLSGKVTENPVTGPQSAKTWAQEFRMVSRSAGEMDWIGGIYYTHTDASGLTTSRLTGIESAVNAIAPGLGTALFPGDATILLDQKGTAREWAAYGELGFKLADHWRLTAGGRYFDYKADDGVKITAYGTPLVVGPLPAQESGFMPKASIAYDQAGALLWYALVSRGYRVGGANITAALAPPEANIPLTYKTDNLWNYETGVKKAWLGGQITGEATLFYIKWSDIQLYGSFPAPSSPSGVVSATLNTGKAHSLGVEGSLGAQVASGLNVSTSIAWTDAKLDEDSIPILNGETGQFVVIPKGTRLPSTPEWAAAVALTYYLNDPSLGYPFASVAYAYKGQVTDGIPTLVSLSSYSLWNLRFGTTMAAGLQVSLAVNNVLDKRSPVSRSSPVKGTFVPETVPETFYITQPRSISLTLQKIF